MDIDVKVAKIKELFYSGILNQMEYEKIISLLSDINSQQVADEELDDETRNYMQLYEICKENTSKLLVAPATAVYPSFNKDMISDSDGQFSFRFNFFVDSQNKNGAMIRTYLRALIENNQYEGTSFQEEELAPKTKSFKEALFSSIKGDDFSDIDDMEWVTTWSPYEKPDD